MSDINLLLLGESGAGKTAFVNSFLNYYTYANVEEARKRGMAVAAPITISFMGNDRKQHSISIEATHKEEPKTSTNGKLKQYLIPVGQRQVRFIVAPGFESGDESHEDIFKQLTPLKQLHGVCFFIKSSLSRMSNLFESYLMQALNAFELSMVENFIFVFTFGRSAGFNIGHAKNVMKGVVDSISSRIKTRIPLNEKNMYCLENEAFINFALERHGAEMSEGLIKILMKSWEISVAECQRLMSYIETLSPYKFPTNGVINDLEQFILQKSYNLCDIFGTNYKNLQKCQELKDSSEEACRLIQSMQRQKIYYSDKQPKVKSIENESSQSSYKKHEMTEGEKFKSLPKSEHRSRIADYTQGELLSDKAWKNEGKLIKQSSKGTYAHLDFPQETGRPKQDSEKTTDALTAEIQKNLDYVSRVLKEQNNFIHNVYKTVKAQKEEIRESFLKNMAKFELFLEKNGTDYDAFRKQLTSDVDRASKFKNLLQEYQRVKEEMRRSTDRDLTEQEIVTIMKKIEKSKHQQEVLNKICDE